MSFHLKVPDSAYDQLRKYFKEFCGTDKHMNGLNAANLLLQSGLPKHTALRLWNSGTAAGCNFDSKWFVRSMFEVTAWRNLRTQTAEDVLWKMKETTEAFCDICMNKFRIGDISYLCDLIGNWCCCHQCSKTHEATGHKLRPWRLRRLNLEYAADGLIFCDKCPSIFQVGDCIYNCEICNGGNFHLCPACHAISSKRCGHDLKLCLITVSKNFRWFRHVTCDRCSSRCKSGSWVFYCKICNKGNFDLCEACYAIPSNRCGHALSHLQVKHLQDKGLEAQKNYGSPSDVISSPISRKVDKLGKAFNDLQLRDSLQSSILTEKPRVRWDDVAGLEPAKNELREAIVLPIKHPQLFDGKRQPKRAILMYGPPGTGKSYLAKAVATEVDHTLFSISSSDLMSKWFGESEGLVRQLFQLAREKQPSIIFIDEIDALCGNRDRPGGGNEHTARMKTEFLVQVDGVGKDNHGVLLLAATNRPWELDPAVRRRFQKRVHIPLPDQDARKQLFRIHGAESTRSFSDDQLEVLAQRTEGLSGSDIANASQEAMLFPIRKATKAKFFREVRLNGDIFFKPCESTNPYGNRMNWEDVPDGRLLDPDVQLEDFLEAVQGFKSSVAPEEVQRCYEWTKQYGSEGA